MHAPAASGSVCSGVTVAQKQGSLSLSLFATVCMYATLSGIYFLDEHVRSLVTFGVLRKARRLARIKRWENPYDILGD